MRKRKRSSVPHLLSATYPSILTLPAYVSSRQQQSRDAQRAVHHGPTPGATAPDTRPRGARACSKQAQHTVSESESLEAVYVVQHAPFSGSGAAQDGAEFATVVRSALKELEGRREAFHNVLRSGEQAQHSAARAAQQQYANAALEHLHTDPTWRALHSRIGGREMFHLLVSCSVFVQLPGSSALLQVAGHSFAAVAQKRAQASPPNVTNASGSAASGPADHQSKRPVKRLCLQAGRATVESKSSAGNGAAVRPPVHARRAACTAAAGSTRMALFVQAAAVALAQNEPSAPLQRRCRPPSWRRRKIKAQHAARAAGATSLPPPEHRAGSSDGLRGGGETSPARPAHAARSTDRKRPRCEPLVVPVEVDRSARALTRIEGATADSGKHGCVKEGSAGQGPQRQVGARRRGTGPKMPPLDAARLTLPRHACFFSADYAPRAGLPQAHPLLALPPSRNGARTLLGCIWGSTAPLSPEKVFSSEGCRGAASLHLRLSPAQQALMLEVAEKLLQRARKLPWRALLDTHCPCPDLTQKRPSQRAQHTQHSQRAQQAQTRPGALEGACSTAGVCGFVCAVLRRLLPAELLGGRCANSQRALLRHVCKFIALRRFEQMAVHDVMHGMRTSGTTWLDVLEVGGHRARAHCVRQQQVALLVWWLFGAIVVPTLRCCFYITETQPLKFATVYYRKPTWRALAAQAAAQLTSTIYRPIPERTALRMLASRPLGPTRLRHLPKTKGMRPVANLSCKTAVRVPQRARTAKRRAPRGAGEGAASRPICIDTSPLTTLPAATDCSLSRQARNTAVPPTPQLPPSLAFEPINKVLQPVHAVFKAEAQRAAQAPDTIPDLLSTAPVCEACGAAVASAADESARPSGLFAGSVPSFSAAHAQLRQFAAEWRAARQPPLTALAFDVSKAFDHVDTAAVRTLLTERLIASSRWDVHRAQETFQARGRLVTKYRPYAVPACAAHSTAAAPSGNAVPGIPQHTAGSHTIPCAAPLALPDPTTTHRTHRDGALASLCSTHAAPAHAVHAASQHSVLSRTQFHGRAVGGTVEGWELAKAPLDGEAAGGRGGGAAVAWRGAVKVVADCGRRVTVSREDVARLLEAHLQGSLVKLGSRWHEQQRGIPQGAITSSLLCDLFLSHLQTMVLIPALHLPQDTQHTQHAQHPAHLRHRAASAAAAPSRSDDPIATAAMHLSVQNTADVHMMSTCCETADMLCAAHPCDSHSTPRAQTDRTVPTVQQAGVIEGAGGQPAAQVLCAVCRCAAAAERSTQHAARALRPLLVHMADDFLLLTAVPEVAQRVAAACSEELPKHGVTVSTDKMHCSHPLPGLRPRHISPATPTPPPSRAAASHAAHTPPCPQADATTSLNAVTGMPGPRCVANVCAPSPCNQAAPAAVPDRHAARVGLEGSQQGRVVGLGPANRVPWCGLLLDVETLSLQADYGRLRGLFARDLINAPACRPAALPDKVCAYANAKLQPLLLDPALNGTAVVGRTLHACAAFAAIKMHCCLCAMRERGVAGRSTQHAQHVAAAKPRSVRGGAVPLAGPGAGGKAAGRKRRGRGGRGFCKLDCTVIALAVVDRVREYVVSACMRTGTAAHARCKPILPQAHAGVPSQVEAGDSEGDGAGQRAVEDGGALSADDIEMLVVAGFRRVLRRKHGTYASAVRELSARLQRRRLQSCAARWADVVEPCNRLPEELRGIRW
eukprot:jgi/Ulvmu1/6800/UM031_0001.1